MDHKSESSKIGVIILKMFFIAILTYIFLYIFSDRNIPHQYNRGSDIPQVSPVLRFGTTGDMEKDTELENKATRILDQEHESASLTDSMYTLCSKYEGYCSMTTFDAKNLSDKQKLYYQTLLIYIMKKFDALGIPISDYIDSILVKYENTRSRGYSSRHEMVLNIKPMGSYGEFANVVLHELGHFVDFDYLAGDDTLPRDPDYTEFGKKMFPLDDLSLDFYKLNRSNENTRRSTVTYKDFVSGYAMTDPFEMFAEAMHFYLNFNGIFKELSRRSPILKQQYDFFDDLFGGGYISDGLKKKVDFEKYDWDFRPYDTTRF